MKATKKIVGAACALVAAVGLAAGSTYAWFSSNNQVTAEGLKISVTTSNSYLVIGNEYNEIRGEGVTYKTKIDLLDASATKLNPSAHLEGEDLTTEHLNTVTATDAGALATEVTAWYTGKGKSPTDGTLDEGGTVGDVTKPTTKADLETLTGYVVVDEIYVGVSTGSDAAKVTMSYTDTTSWVTTNSAATNNSALSVIILYQTIANGGTDGKYKMVESNAANSHALSLDLGELTDQDYCKIKVLVYFDGNNKDVKSQNAKNLTGITIGFKFDDTTPTTPEVTEP